MAEARATHKAVTFAQEMSFFRIHVEGDCLGVIRALQSQGQCKTLYGHVVDDFFHIRREGNKLAHELARSAVLSANTDIWVEDLPDDLDIVF